MPTGVITFLYTEGVPLDLRSAEVQVLLDFLFPYDTTKGEKELH